MSNTPISPHSKLVEEAVRAVGSRDKVAKLYTPPLSRQAISKWIKRGWIVDQHSFRVRIFAKAAGVPRSVLNPDFAE